MITRRVSLFNLQATRTAWFQIRAQATGPTVVNIYDEIGIWGVSAKQFVAELGSIKGPLDVHLNTPGGSIFDGVAIYDALKSRSNVSVTIDGLAASIGSVIAQAASPGQLSIGKNASMMIHDGWGDVTGNASDLTKAAALLEAQSANIASIYAERSGRSADQWRAAMQDETWYIGQAAVDAGLADRLTDAKPGKDTLAIAASWDLSAYEHAPANLLALLAAVGEPYRPQPYERDTRENTQCPTCGCYGDQDAAYCGQCGTKLAGREDVDEAHGADETRDATPMTPAHAHLLEHLMNADTGTWDGPAAMSAAASSDNPASAFKAICAGRREGDPALEASWALPHHEHPGDAPNAAGVRNALARLPQTHGLINSKAAQAHLEAHMREINPDGAESAANHAELLPQLPALSPFTNTVLKGVLA